MKSESGQKALSYAAFFLYFLSTLAPDLSRQFPDAKWTVTLSAVVAAGVRFVGYAQKHLQEKSTDKESSDKIDAEVKTATTEEE